MEELKSVLEALDHDDDNDWTSDGFPRVGRVNELSKGNYTRTQIAKVAPNLCRHVNNQSESQAAESLVSDNQDADEDQTEDSVDESSEVEGGIVEHTTEVGGHPCDVDNILNTSLIEILSSVESARMASSSLNELINIKSAESKEINKELEKLHRASNLISRQLSKIPVDQTKNISDYISKSAEARGERAARAKKFIDAQTSPGDVAKQMQVASPLDQKMKQRGSQRPTIAPR